MSSTAPPAAPGYGPLDIIRNALTVAAAVALIVFHHDVGAYVPAAAFLVAGIDVTATHLLKGKGGILHRLEAAVSGLAQALGQAVGMLPAGSPAAAAKAAAEAGAIAGEVATLTATAAPAAAPPVINQITVHTAPAPAPPDPGAPAAGGEAASPM